MRNGLVAKKNNFPGVFVGLWIFSKILMVFWSKTQTWIQKNVIFPWEKYYFLKTRLSELTSIFDPILASTWLDFSTQNPPKSTQKSIPRGIKKMMHFCIDFLSILAPTWDPSWGHVGHFFRTRGGTMWNATFFFVALVFSFDFFAPRPDGVPHFGLPSGLDFGGVWSNFGSMLGPT